MTGIDEETQRGSATFRAVAASSECSSATRSRSASRRLSEHPDSIGFPPNHPPMTSFLGVPIVLRGVAYGNLYLTEKADGEFAQEDEDVITLLAAQAAVAIENARLYESATRWSRQLESLIEVGQRPLRGDRAAARPAARRRTGSGT